MTPPMIMPQKIDKTTQTSRTAVTSTWKYSAIPPQTPAICLSVVDRLSTRAVCHRHRLVVAFRHDEPGGHVNDDAADDSAGKGQYDQEQADEHDIDTIVIGEPCTHTGDASIGSRTSQAAYWHHQPR